MCVFIRNKTSIYCDHYHGIEIKAFFLCSWISLRFYYPTNVCGTHRIMLCGLYTHWIRKNGNFRLSRLSEKGKLLISRATNEFHSISNQIKAKGSVETRRHRKPNQDIEIVSEPTAHNNYFHEFLYTIFVISIFQSNYEKVQCCCEARMSNVVETAKTSQSRAR